MSTCTVSLAGELGSAAVEVRGEAALSSRRARGSIWSASKLFPWSSLETTRAQAGRAKRCGSGVMEEESSLTCGENLPAALSSTALPPGSRPQPLELPLLSGGCCTPRGIRDPAQPHRWLSNVCSLINKE